MCFTEKEQAVIDWEERVILCLQLTFLCLQAEKHR